MRTPPAAATVSGVRAAARPGVGATPLRQAHAAPADTNAYPACPATFAALRTVGYPQGGSCTDDTDHEIAARCGLDVHEVAALRAALTAGDGDGW